jgi:hypothetical protein
MDNDIFIETKIRLANDKPMYKDPNDTNLTNKAIFSLLMKDGFGPFQSAFDEQNSDIAMVSLSISSYGFMLSSDMIAYTDLRFTMTTALEMAKNKEKVVSSTPSHGVPLAASLQDRRPSSNIILLHRYSNHPRF